MLNYIVKSHPKIIGLFFNTLGLFFPNYISKKVISIFSKPRKGRYKNVPLNDSFSHSEDIEFGSGFTKIYFHGNGQDKILLLHGWESNSNRWKRFIKHTLKLGNFNFISLDAPAHGKATNDQFSVMDYVHLIEKIASSHNINYIIGHSIGGFCALMAASRMKLDNVRLIVLGSPFSLNAVFEKYYEAIGLNKFMVDKINKNFHKNFNHNLFDFDVNVFGKNILTKGIIIHDKFDNVNEVENAYIIKKNWTISDLIITENKGHSLQHSEIYDEILFFITKSTPKIV